jgi:hypothetical protein
MRKKRIKDEAIKRPGDIKTVFTGKNPRVKLWLR